MIEVIHRLRPVSARAIALRSELGYRSKYICNKFRVLQTFRQASTPECAALVEWKLDHRLSDSSATRGGIRTDVLYTLLLVVLVQVSSISRAGAADVNSSNNPLTQVVTVQIQDYISPSVDRIGGTGNDFETRGLIPYKLFGTDQLVRVTAPVETLPEDPGSSTTGFSNLQIFDLSLIPTSIATFGVGPLLVFPTAGNSTLGTNKWQGGAAGVAVMPRKWGLFAQVLTYQHSFGQGDNGGSTSLITYQPILTVNLPKNFYLRSSGIMSFDLERHSTVVPIGFGAGKVWQLSPKVNLNVFVEPQYSVVHSGVGVPLLQVYTGATFQFIL